MLNIFAEHPGLELFNPYSVNPSPGYLPNIIEHSLWLLSCNPKQKCHKCHTYKKGKTSSFKDKLRDV